MIGVNYAFGLLGLLIAFFWAFPFLKFWLTELVPAQRAWIFVPLVFGVSVGVLSLIIFSVGLWQFNVWVVLGVLLVVGVSGWLIKDWGLELGGWKKFLPAKIFSLQNFFFVLSLITFVLILAHAAYYPFIGDDELSRYAYYGKLIWWRGQVTPDVRGYPMLLPALYAATFALTNNIYQLTGQLAEQLAKIVPVFFSLTTVWATAALAHRWFGRVAGFVSALMLLLTSLYLRWSPEGYVDIPSALYFVLGAYTADVWREKQNMRWAILTGVCVGCSLWTKQAGFAMLPTLGLIFGWELWRQKNWRVARDGILVLLFTFLCGGWWYARNIFYDGWLNMLPTPGDFYTTQAQATLINLIPFLGMPTAFGVAASAAYTIGLIWALVRVRRMFWVLAWALPYTLLWWKSFSYDARFLLTVLPFYAVLVGGLTTELYERLKINEWRLGQIVLVLAVLLGWGTAVRAASLGGVGQWVTAPAASYAERLTRVKGDLYPVVQFVQMYVPVQARILSMDGRVSYYLVERRVDVFYPATEAELRDYDYVIIGSWWILTYDQLGLSWKELVALISQRQRLQLVYTGPTSGLQIYRVMKP